MNRSRFVVSALVVLVLSSPVLAAGDTAPSPTKAKSPWHFGIAVAAGFNPFRKGTLAEPVDGAEQALTVEVAVGRDLGRWTLEAVPSCSFGADGGYCGLSLRPLYNLSAHFDLGVIAGIGVFHLGPFRGLFAAGPHLGFHAGLFEAFIEPLFIPAESPFDHHGAGANGPLFLPVRIGIGLRF